MYKFIKKNQKKVLAIFSVGLMIAFALPTAMTSMSGRSNLTRGYIGKEALADRDVAAANAEWELLKDNVLLRDPTGQLDRPWSVLEVTVDAYTRRQIQNNPDLFALLIHEARSMGVVPNQDELKEILQNTQARPDGQPDLDARVQQAVTDLLLVQAAEARAGQVVKVTQPERTHQLARAAQQISVNLVEFLGKDYLAKVTQPTADELAAQYAKYAELEPDSNAMGFGYKLPNRVKVQYIELPRDQVEKAVSAGIRDQDIRLYYLQHQSHYMTTQPATTQETFSLNPALSRPLLGPTTKPFIEAREDVFHDMVNERSADLTRSILAELTSTLASDYAAWKQATTDAGEHPTSIPASLRDKAPPTSTGPGYGSYDYLAKLALQFQDKYKVLPLVGAVNDWQSQKQLDAAQASPPTTAASRPALNSPAQSNVPRDLANAKTDTANAYQEPVYFPAYATTLVAPLGTEQQARTARVPLLNLNEPSPLLLDQSGNNWVFRVTEIDPAHAQPRDAVIAQIDSDVRRIKAQQLALADAQNFLTEASKSGLRSAAATTRPARQVGSTGLFSASSTGAEVLFPYMLPNDDARRAFITKAYDLLSTPNPRDPEHPLEAIDLPQADRAVVVELKQIKPNWTTADMGDEELEQQRELLAQRDQAFRAQWFNYSNVKARLNYHPVETDKKNEAPPPEEPVQQGPINPLGG